MTIITATDADKIATLGTCRMYDGAAAVVVADHDATDAKGRRIGGVAKITKGPHGYFLRLFATRNGDSFGASPSSTQAGDTLEVAIATAIRKITAQGKRYARIAAK